MNFGDECDECDEYESRVCPDDTRRGVTGGAVEVDLLL